MKILIVGFGNIGRYMHKELAAMRNKIDIYDPFIEEYKTLNDMAYDFAFVCVPTEMLPDGSADISAVEDAVSKISANIIVIKSAVPPGTADFLTMKYGKTLVISPEYYGTTQHSVESPAFLILGGCREAVEEVATLYYKIKSGSYRIRLTDAKTAELAKYMENCFLAMKVTFCNEFADIAAQYGISYPELRELFIMDERMGDSHTFVYPDKPYYDSHCLNKDVPALVAFSKGKAPLLAKMHKINLERKEKTDGQRQYQRGNRD